MHPLMEIVEKLRGTAETINLSFNHPCPALVAAAKEIAALFPLAWLPQDPDRPTAGTGWVSILIGPGRGTLEQPAVNINIWGVSMPVGWTDSEIEPRYDAKEAAGRFVVEYAQRRALGAVESSRDDREIGWEAAIMAGAHGGVL
jgi:hypothetical protein